MVSVVEFGLVVLVATIAGAIAIKLKQPSVIGLLLAGVLVGPHQLGLVAESDLIKIFGEIGAILLLFAIGLEFSLNSLKQLGLKATLLAATKMGFVILLSYLIASAFGLSPLTGLFLGAILSITSTAIFVKIASEKNYVNRKEMPLLVASLIVEDIIAVFLLAIFAGLGGQEEFSLKFIFSIANSLFLFGIFYLVVSPLLKKVLEWLAQNQASETLAFASLTVGVGLGYVAQLAGIPASVGAFLAGSLIASVKNAEEFKQAVYPLIFIFSALFFLSIGLGVNAQLIFSNLWLVLAITVIGIIVKFISMGTSFYLVEADSKSATFAGLAMLSVGEFSLLIASLSKNIVTEIDLVGLTSVLVLTTSLATGLLIDKNETIRRSISKAMPRRLTEAGRGIAQQNKQIFEFFTYSKNFSNLIQKGFNFGRDNLLIIGTALGLLAITLQVEQGIEIAGYNLSYSTLGLAIVIIATLLVAVRIILKLPEVMREASHYLNLGQMMSNLLKLFTTSLLIWLAIIIAAGLIIFNLSFELIDAVTLIALILIAAYFFTSGGSSKGKSIMFKH